MKIYDCFLFFNELDLLEIRLHELNDHVDKFVIVEAAETFTSNPKPYYFEENKERFSKFADKIIHIKIPVNNDIKEPWPKQYYQRNCIAQGLNHCTDEDIIMISDLDEIPKGALIKDSIPKGPEIVEFMMKSYANFINRRMVRTHPRYEKLGGKNWNGTRFIKYKYLTSPQEFRSLLGRYSAARPSGSLKMVHNAGWHFSWMGSPEQLVYKAASVSGDTDVKHGDKKTKAWKENVTKLHNGEGLEGPNNANTAKFMLVEVDNDYPKYLLDNLDRFDYMVYKK